MAWLEVSLTAGGEAAEAVAEVFRRFAPEGVAVEATRLEHLPDSDQARPAGDMIVRAYLPMDGQLDARRAQLEEALWHLGQLLPLPAPEYRPVAETDWSEAWKVNFRPLRVGRRLMIVPAWLDPALGPDDMAIRLDPGMAFGTGTHPTTQLCLEALERHLQPGQAVLDLGTGSGILAIAAARLGAGPILAVDIDEEAVRVARDNTAANGVAAAVHVARGSLSEVLAGEFGGQWQQAPLVVANILARVIVTLLDDGLARVVAPGGLLIVSGILDTQAYQVIAALKAHGLAPVAQEHKEDWVAILASK
jgi:ribosomal protein L11 methyltransferase